MMGCGKSTIGKRLAKKMGLNFVDSDDEIVAAAGMSIPDIFAQHGEKDFRSGEMRVILRLLENGPQIMATGGGAFCQTDTGALIAQKAITIWLQADVNMIFRRVSRHKERPLLNAENPKQIIHDMLKQRSPLYAKADIHIDSDQNTQEATTDEVIAALEKIL